MRYPTRRTAITTLARWFAGVNSDYVSVDDIYRIANRRQNHELRNKRWLTNRLGELRHHGLITSVYTSYTPENPTRRLAGARLTKAGKMALAGHDRTSGVTLESIRQDIQVFEQQNPSVQLTLTARPRLPEPHVPAADTVL